MNTKNSNTKNSNTKTLKNLKTSMSKGNRPYMTWLTTWLKCEIFSKGKKVPSSCLFVVEGCSDFHYFPINAPDVSSKYWNDVYVINDNLNLKLRLKLRLINSYSFSSTQKSLRSPQIHSVSFVASLSS